MNTQTPSIPFKSFPATSAWQVLGNSTIGEINVPKFGSVTYGEWSRYYDGLAKIEQSVDLTQDQKGTRIRGLQASLVLQRIEPEWDPELIGEAWQARDAQGETSPIYVSDLLVSELSKFFLSELNRWLPSGYVMLIEHELFDEAERLAIAAAKEQGLVAMTRSDLRLQGIYLLYRRKTQPKGGTPAWEVVADHTREEDFEADEEEQGAKK